jgi:uncharacterized protein YcbX
MTSATLHSIHRYPLKGFAGQVLAQATLTAGKGIPFDRFFGIFPAGARGVPQRSPYRFRPVQRTPADCLTHLLQCRRAIIPGGEVHL